MNQSAARMFAIIFSIIFLVQLGLFPIIADSLSSEMKPNGVDVTSSGVNVSNITSLGMVTLVESNPSSFVDEFAYIAAVPTSVFVHSGTQYLSPLILSDGSDTETWLLEDWAEYMEPDGGVHQFRVIGDIPSSRITQYRSILGTSVFPWIRGSSPAEIAALLAVSDWSSSDIAVFAIASETFDPPADSSDSVSFSFQNEPMQIVHPEITISSSSPVQYKFTPPTDAGWIEGSFDWTGNLYFTHTLTDPNGNIVDYSVRSQTYQERFSSYVDRPVPLKFWVPKTADGEWTLTLYPQSSVSSSVTLDASIIFHPGHSSSISVPSGAKSLSVTIDWDNSATDLNLALIDPNGHLGAWAPAGSIIASPGSESIDVQYPMKGTWTAIVSWMNATNEQNNVKLSWATNAISTDVASYFESATNGAVLASLLNAPLLYVTPDSVPEVTQWAIDHLGISISFLVDPVSLQSSSLVTALNEFSFVNNLNNYHLVSQWIQQLSGNYDVVVTVPRGNGDELFAPAAYSGAFHGAPVFSLCGDDNHISSLAEATWSPYLIGPEIDIYVRSRYTTRTENGWYDERIPNKYTMQYSANSFESFLETRGAYNASEPQSVVVLGTVDEIKPSFDRSLQSHFSPGRIPAETAAMASSMIVRAALHRFIFRVADAADEALVSMYAYTADAGFVDNNFNYYIVDQYENSTDMLANYGFDVQTHIGYQEVFSTIASQVAFWTFSTHGSLTRYPTDPPDRPDGLGLFSLRETDAPYGVETTTARDANGDHLVNPVLYEEEAALHRIENTDNLEAAIDNIGTPIVIITACLLGGTRLPIMLMEHGAVGVMASPRTVYFQPAAMLSLLVMRQLTSGESQGRALSYAISTISIDYTNPLSSGDPRDYANQHILYGDPDVHLYEPDSTPRIVSVNPDSLNLNGHSPGNGLPSVACLGTTDYISSVLDDLSVDYDFYTTSNFSEFVRFIDLRRTVIIEPESITALSTYLSQNGADLTTYVRSGGTLVILGVRENLSWLPWNFMYNSSSSGDSVTIIDSYHPLVTYPNTLATDLPFQGCFSDIWLNYTVLATSPFGDPVFIAATVGVGKIALTTINPSGSNREMLIENIVSWAAQPSIFLRSAVLSETIIWAGDYVVLSLTLDDGRGHPVTGATLRVLFNDTDVTALAQEVESGVYIVTLAPDWTNQYQGIFCLRVYASKNGFDTLSAVIPQFIFIRPSPLLAIGVVSAVFCVIIVAYVYRKRSRGEPIFSRRRRSARTRTVHRATPRPLSKEEELRLKREREKKERKKDLKDFFGV